MERKRCPEANLFALEEAASTTSWRTGSERILVWFGDAPGNDPDGGSTEVSATAALVAADIQVEAINITTFSAGGHDLDSCPTDRAGSCAPSSSGGGTAGQASRITAATGGSLHTSTNSAAIVAVINGAIATAVSEYSLLYFADSRSKCDTFCVLKQ